MAQSISLQTSNSTVDSGDVLGRLNYAASNESSGGDSVSIGASIYAQAEGEFTSTANPTSLFFSTANSDLAEARLRLSSVGHLLPVSNNAINLGSNDFRYNTSYINNMYSNSLLAGSGLFSNSVVITQSSTNTPVLTSTGYSLTGSNAQSMIDVSGVWNTTGTPTLIKANVTDTASNDNSLLMDLQVGGTSRFRVDKSGNIRIANHAGLVSTGSFGGVYVFNNVGTPVFFRDNDGTQRAWLTSTSFAIASTYAFSWSVIGTGFSAPDLFVYRDAANTLAQRNSTNAQTFRIYNTYTSATSYERGKLEWASNVFRIGTEKGSAGGSARAMEFQTDGTTRLTISDAGLFTIADALNIAVGTTTGTKIGTGTTQKIGFYDKTPVVQPTAVADATDAASVITQLNALLSRMRDLGLIAT